MPPVSYKGPWWAEPPPTGCFAGTAHWAPTRNTGSCCLLALPLGACCALGKTRYPTILHTHSTDHEGPHTYKMMRLVKSLYPYSHRLKECCGHKLRKNVDKQVLSFVNLSEFPAAYRINDEWLCHATNALLHLASTSSQPPTYCASPLNSLNTRN